jgi:uncharacterized protein
MEFDWDGSNTDHIARHKVETWEAEEAVQDPERTPFPAHSGAGGFIGKTEDGRYLVVIVTRRYGAWRVITAREATAREKKAYRRFNR